MIIIEIEPNSNCEAVDMRLFHDLEPARRVHQVRLEREFGKPQWFDVTGWTQDEKCREALVQKVDDSGDGIALLIHGGDAGLRFRPSASDASWHSGNPDQWGLPFFLTVDMQDIKIEENTSVNAGGHHG